MRPVDRVADLVHDGVVERPPPRGPAVAAPPSLSATQLVPEDGGIVPVLQNIVCTVTLGCPLDLKRITLHARNAEYNPKRFAAVIMRIRDPKTTALIFASGKMVCTGAKHEEQCRQAARKYTRIIQKLGFPAKFSEFKVQNIVATCDVRFPIRLEGLAFEHCNFERCCPGVPDSTANIFWV